jgi:protocatechuate 3,4-dioxygenase beta subunit
MKPILSRRSLLHGIAMNATLFTVPGYFAQELTRTPFQTEGPFYPDKLPLDTDNDLIVINDALTPAVGEITHLSGRLVDHKGDPIRNAVVEIWQVNAKGAYIHSQSANRANTDTHFQGFGRFLTGSTGEYYFRTIKPIPYPGRTPHIHFKVKVKGQPVFTTQCYIKGHPQNERDGVLRQYAREPKVLAATMAEFTPMKESSVGEHLARWDIVLGLTPDDNALHERLRRSDRG